MDAMRKMTRREFLQHSLALAAGGALLAPGCAVFARKGSRVHLMERRLNAGEVLFQSREGIELVFERAVLEIGGNAACLSVAKGKEKIGDIYIRPSKGADVLFYNGEVLVRYEGDNGFIKLGAVPLRSWEEGDDSLIRISCVQASASQAIFEIGRVPQK